MIMSLVLSNNQNILKEHRLMSSSHVSRISENRIVIIPMKQMRMETNLKEGLEWKKQVATEFVDRVSSLYRTEME